MPVEEAKNGDGCAHLSHEIVEGEYWPRDVEQHVECVHKIFPEDVHGVRVEHSRLARHQAVIALRQPHELARRQTSGRVS